MSSNVGIHDHMHNVMQRCNLSILAFGKEREKRAP